MKNIILSISVIIGTLIGAGFASGKEIEIFFCKYGKYGFFGIILSSCLIGWMIYAVFKFSENYQIKSYEQFLEKILEKSSILYGKDKKKNWMLSTIKNIVNLFLLISFFIMVAGFGSYFYQEFSIKPIWGALLLVMFCYITFQKGITGITKISTLLVPILIGFIFLLGLQKAYPISLEKNHFQNVSYSWILSSILYGSYNTILLIPILFPLKKYISHTKESKKISIFSMLIILLLSTIIYGIVLENYHQITSVEIPMLFIMEKKGKWYQYFYSILILISIYTSAISARIWVFTKWSKKESSEICEHRNMRAGTSCFWSRIFFTSQCIIPYFRNHWFATDLSNCKMPEKYLKKKEKTDIT